VVRKVPADFGDEGNLFSLTLSPELVAEYEDDEEDSNEVPVGVHRSYIIRVKDNYIQIYKIHVLGFMC
jgi:hypothetical protein